MNTGTDRALTELIERYEHAFNTNDAKAMNDLFADTPVFVNFSGNLVKDKESLHRAQSFVFGPGGPLEAISVSYAVESITHLSAELAVIHARQRTRRTETTDNDREDPMEAIFMAVAQRTGGEWQIKIGQNTPVM
ncbi:SgcJ/EcaC family oxidoreductase [Saccharopolyspora indica]|uniref:YybH family protein n=1 Tax=Saccharopolyspora indica TaxID=1229659 RepID=UPI0022EBA1FB|nr:SgcJ/EcaC family oxidoreductase [Saccharopolyspora indica]MDA3646686.1 SgcJ/EcaC family oxidoreductase [Saccharopolyspora indica]